MLHYEIFFVHFQIMCMCNFFRKNLCLEAGVTNVASWALKKGRVYGSGWAGEKTSQAATDILIITCNLA